MSELYISALEYADQSIEFGATFAHVNAARAFTRDVVNDAAALDEVRVGHVVKLATGNFAEDEHQYVYTYPSVSPASRSSK